MWVLGTVYVLHEIGWKGGVWCQICELVDTGHLKQRPS